jgi:adenine phosphoribosyltransferase
VDLKKYIRTIPDFPKPGIQFRDITSLLRHPEGFQFTNDMLHQRYKRETIDAVVGIESRGFVFGSVLSQLLGCAFVPVRKEGKLPHVTLRQEYTLEYGDTAIEIHDDALHRGDQVVIVDDLLATGGTLLAASKLVELLGAEIVECAVVIELTGLEGRKRLGNYEVFSIVQYD